MNNIKPKNVAFTVGFVYNVAMDGKFNKHEVKFSNTAKKMRSAILELLSKKDFTEITVSDVCEKAKVNRSTFYAHYDNTAELVGELEDELISRFVEQNADLVDKQVIKDVSASKINILISDDVLVPYLGFVKEYRHVFRIYHANEVFSKSRHEQILKELVFEPAFRANNISDGVTSEYVFAYFLNGINAIIKKWVFDGCRESAETVSSILRLCILNILKIK